MLKKENEPASVRVYLDPMTYREINTIAISYRKMAYQKSIENRLAILKESFANNVISKEVYEKHMNDLWADCCRGE